MLVWEGTYTTRETDLTRRMCRRVQTGKEHEIQSPVCKKRMLPKETIGRDFIGREWQEGKYWKWDSVMNKTQDSDWLTRINKQNRQGILRLEYLHIQNKSSWMWTKTVHYDLLINSLSTHFLTYTYTHLFFDFIVYRFTLLSQ